MAKMTRNQNDLSERTLAETVEGAGDKYGASDLGKLSNVKRAPRKPKPAAAPQVDPTEAMKAMFLANINTDLRARDGKGNPLPTLQQRVAQEGVRAQYRGKQTMKPSAAKDRNALKRTNHAKKTKGQR